MWKFRVRQDAEPAFTEMYGPLGAWALLFRTAPGFLGTELLRDLEGARRYVTIDRWESRDAYDAFRRASEDEYEALDRAGARLTDVESLVGDFGTVTTG
jgi:heme-degrading monooxygenase HmoA